MANDAIYLEQQAQQDAQYEEQFDEKYFAERKTLGDALNEVFKSYQKLIILMDKIYEPQTKNK